MNKKNKICKIIHELDMSLMCISDAIHDESKFGKKSESLVKKMEIDYSLIKKASALLKKTHLYIENNGGK